ncbi:MAG: hypothetical protein N2645_05975 [Clostridia bacterium]|nr:hypothetical protein [Clostridia bacterium]
MYVKDLNGQWYSVDEEYLKDKKVNLEEAFEAIVSKRAEKRKNIVEALNKLDNEDIKILQGCIFELNASEPGPSAQVFQESNTLLSPLAKAADKCKPDGVEGCGKPDGVEGCGKPDGVEGCGKPDGVEGCGKPDGVEGCGRPDGVEGCGRPECGDGCNNQGGNNGCKKPEIKYR